MIARPASPMQATAIGVDIGGTNLRAARISGGGEVLEWAAERIVRDPETVLDRITALCRQLDDGSVIGVGIGIPGRVDARHRQVLSGGYVNLANASLAERLGGALERPVIIDNDCNMALVAEMATGAAQGRENVVMFTIGTGIGGAVVIDNKLLRGRAAAGQLGHLTVDPNGALCACGRRGCVETTSSGTALGHLIAESDLPPETRVDDLFDREALGDATARSILGRWIHPLRDAIDSMVATVDPDLVLIGGGLGSSAQRALVRAPARAPWYQCPVEAARLGDDAGVIGAGLSVLIEQMTAGGSARFRDAGQASTRPA